MDELPTTPFIEKVLKPGERRIRKNWEQALADIESTKQRCIREIETGIKEPSTQPYKGSK